ncbi:MAG: L,D-transpeptidase [Actinomycetota bacterium]|nr:L,D-transpeptidase [Actinomycetota bacterium]
MAHTVHRPAGRRCTSTGTRRRPSRHPADRSRSLLWQLAATSSTFNIQGMFGGGTAFHQGSLNVESHGCVHLSSASAQYYWRALDDGAVVQVFGNAPY